MFKSRLGSITLATISLLAIFLLNASPFYQDEGDEINGDALEVGDVAVEGIPTGDGICEFDGFLISTTADEEDTTQWLSMALDDECRFVVDARWAGELEDGPASIVEPLIALLPYQSEPVDETPSEGTEESAALSLVTCKQSRQYVYMYGWGGPIDKLTHKWGTLHFCYTGSSATINTHSGTCQGSQLLPTWSWTVVSCTTFGVVPGPASSVERTGRGTYRCTPINTAPCNISNPDGYNHTLTEKITGSGSGSSSCTYGFGGQIVFGVGRQILQGCN